MCIDLDSVATWARVGDIPARLKVSSIHEREFLYTQRRLRKYFSRFVRRLRAGTLWSLPRQKRRRLTHRMARLTRRLQRLASRLGWSLAGGVLSMSVAVGAAHGVTTFEERLGAANPLDAVAVTGNSYPVLVDIDDDGDFDLFVGEYGSAPTPGSIHYYENVGSATSPSFQAQAGAANPLGDLVGSDVLALYGAVSPSFVDIDNDGDFDAFVGAAHHDVGDDAHGSTLYYENTGTPSSPTFTRRSVLSGPGNPLGFVNTGSEYGTLPTFVDIDADGDLDAFVGIYSTIGDVLFFENTGIATNPSFVERVGAANPLTSAYSDYGAPAPSFVDIDSDGDLDVFVGVSPYVEIEQNADTYQAVIHYRNTGTPSAPAFVRLEAADNPLDILPYDLAPAPSLVDVDGDGDADAIIGNRFGSVYYYENTTPIPEPDPLEVVVQADADADGVAESTAAPYVVNEYSDPPSVIVVDVTGGVGPTHTLEIVSVPSLGTLIDPSTGDDLLAGDTLTVTSGSVEVQYSGAPQSSAGFEASDAFIIDVTDDGDPTVSSGSMVVDLNIVDVNQPVVVDREGSAFAASGSIVNIPLVDLADTDSDGSPDPSIYDSDGDGLVFSSAVSALGASVSVAGATLRYTAPAYTDVAFGDGLTDVVTLTVADNSELGSAPVTATTLVDIHPVAEVALSIHAGDGSFSRDLRFGAGPEGVIDISPTSTGTIRDLTAEPAPPEAPGTPARAWINSDGAYVRVIEPISSTASPYTWSIHTRTGSAGSGSTIEWHAPDVVVLLGQFEGRTDVPHSAAITDASTGETWDMSGEGLSSIQIADNTSYNFDITVSPAGGTTPVSGSLSPGWNLVSVPGMGDLSPLDAFTNSAFVWNNGYKGVGFLTQDEIPAVAGGVFINSNGGTYDLDVDVDSAFVRDITVHLDPGWNLIGAPASVGSDSNFPASNISKLFGNQAAVFGYDVGSGGYSLTSELVSGNGYWVYNDTGAPVEAQLTQPRHLDADGSSLFHPAQTPSAPSLSSLDWSLPLSLELEDGGRRPVQLGLSSYGREGYDRLDIAMPPQPPTRDYSHLYLTVEDAVQRLTRSVQAMERDGTEWVMSARVDGASGVLEWERPNVPAHWRLTMEAGDAVIDMVERQSAHLGGGTHELKIGLTWTAPTATRLMPNYPNPFNPETWIPFELTEEADVTVRIYGKDGAVVRSLNLGRRPEGYYTGGADAAYWDGRNELGEPVASGVYLYEIRAGEYRAIRRMTLMK
ncbi:hypothetical protein HN371_05145 [Candidatus Poribacteria bacterium]|nr:hypothetical protein [Candidatus Poribacteria bacterium]MBT5531600.1 hypothetical protein [Candidatus Poribacteria bacterium]MBT5709785.1 hypothetical protein [Candidatus Poribacteria bacterium]MBT7805745.1 hypothetical protein [Candidatus Poribacteria bacterium]